MCSPVQNKSVRLWALFAPTIIGIAGPAMAQGGTGEITGTAVDGQGGVLPGVTVTLRNQETGVARTTVTERTARIAFRP